VYTAVICEGNNLHSPFMLTISVLPLSCPHRNKIS